MTLPANLRRGRRLKRDAIVNGLLTVVRVVFALWVIRLAAQVFSPTALGIFLLIRRVSSTGANLAHFGIPATICRFWSIHTKDESVKKAYLAAAVLLWAGIASVLSGMWWAGESLLSGWIFPGLESAPEYLFVTIALAAASVLHFIASASLMAERKIFLLNLHELVDTAAVLALVLLILGRAATPEFVLLIQALLMIAISWALMLYFFHRFKDQKETVPLIRAALPQFWSFGVPRSGINFLDMLVLLIGPWMLRDQPETAGHLIIALTVVQGLETLFMPVSRLAGVVAARLERVGDEESIRVGVRLLFGTALYTATFAVVWIFPLRRNFLLLWLGDAELVAGVDRFLAILLWVAIPYSFFQILKGVIDLKWAPPLNLYTLVLGLGAFSLVYYSASEIVSLTDERVTLALVVCMGLLGLASLYWVRDYLKPLDFWGLRFLAFALAILGVAGLFLPKDPPSVLSLGLWCLGPIPFLALFWAYSPTPFLKMVKFFVRE